MRLNLKVVIIIVLILCALNSYSQPIPVEFMAGNRYATINVVMSKNFTENSQFGFFHLNTLTMDYNDKYKDDLAIQNLLIFEPLKNFRITSGAYYSSKPGFSPTAGVQYINAAEKLFILFSPRVNIESDPSYSIFSILRYKTKITNNTSLYTSLQALNIFDENDHIKSYQWTRIGLEINGTQFGLAVNFDEFGPNPQVKFSIGLFLRREIP